MRNKREEDAEFWALNGIDPPWMYFGADDGGSFRIYPGRQSESCGTYDPRSRPWYVAGSSGRKDIVLVLDIASGGEYSLDLIKEAARGVVRTLGAGDRVGVVSFGYGGSTRMAVDGTDLASASRENKERLLGEIGRLEGEAAGRDGDVKDVHEAFDLAFGAFGSKAGQEEEVRPGCNAAVVFITDGKMTAWDGGSNATAVAMQVPSNATAAVTEEGLNATAAVTEGTSNATAAMTEGGSNATAVATEEGSNATTAMTAAGTNVTAALMEEDAIVDLIARGKAVVESRTGRRLTVFAYSPGKNGNNDVDDDGGDRIRGRSSFPKRVACATGGIWTPVEDGRDLAKRVSAYHRAFASPLNAAGVDDGGVGAFTAWAEPYEFATGPGLLGTTVSAPVYDRSGGFVGVAGMDFALDSLLRAGGGAGAVVRRWADRCPPGLDLSGCRMGALRLRAGGGRNESLCDGDENGDCAVSAVGGEFEHRGCPGESDLVRPKDLWANSENEGLPYEERVCCRVGETGPSDQCSRKGGGGGGLEAVAETIKEAASSLPIGPIVGGLVVVLVVILLVYRRKTRQGEVEEDKIATNNGAEHLHTTGDPSDVPTEGFPVILPSPHLQAPPPPDLPTIPTSSSMQDDNHWSNLPTISPSPSLRAVLPSDL